MSRGRYDCIVIGLGGHGSAALYHLAQKGVKVLGIEQYGIAHDKGSSHGESRIIRIAYHEHADYVPLLKKAWDLWLDLQKKSGQFLLCDTKCIEACEPDFHGGNNCFQKARLSAEEYDLEHEILSGDEAVLGPGGILASERCIAAHIQLAQEAGAETRFGEAVVSWQSLDPSGEVIVRTNSGKYRAKKLVLAAGSWNAQLVPELKVVLKAERQVIGWFEVLQEGCCDRLSFPVGIIDSHFGNYYYFPVFEQPGMKIGKFNHLWETVEDPAKLDRRITQKDEQALRDGIAAWFPAANGKMLTASACMFTNTPDHHFIIDKHPNHSNVIICSPCSGHGYKFCSVVGEMVSDLVQKGSSPMQTDLVKLRRARPGFAELHEQFEKSSRRSRL